MSMCTHFRSDSLQEMLKNTMLLNRGNLIKAPDHEQKIIVTENKNKAHMNSH